MRLLKILTLLCVTVIFNSCESENLRDTSFADFQEAPTNVSVHIKVPTDLSGNVTIAPYGDGVDSFEVDLGDGSEVQEISAGTVINHVYETGDYEVTVVATSITGLSSAEITNSFFVLSSCIAETEENADGAAGPLNITILDKYKSTFTPIGGLTTAPVANPSLTLSNTSCTVQEVVRVDGCTAFAGLLKLFSAPFAISEDADTFTMDLYGEQTVDVNILFVGSQIFNITQSVTKTGAREKLSFDLSPYHGDTISRILIYFDKGEACDDSIYYFDNIQLLAE